MFNSLRQIPDEVLDEILDKKEDTYYDAKDRELEKIGE